MHYDPVLQKRHGVMEILNDWGRWLVEIDGVVWDVDEFIHPETHGSDCSELVGRNISGILSSNTTSTGFSEHEKNIILQKLNNITTRRRKFSPLLPWKEYLATQAYNS